MKLVISNKKGQAKQVEVEDAKALMGKKIGEKISGDVLDLSGSELEIRGGSDSAGFPMRRDVQGTGRKRILAVSGLGVKAKAKGQRSRKTVAGNTIGDETAQVNLFAVKEGNIFEEPKEAAAEGSEAAPEAPEERKEEPKEEKQEAPKEESKEEKKEASEEKPAEEKKE